MIGTKEICALLLSGAMGATTATVATKHVAKPKRAIHKPAPKRIAPKALARIVPQSQARILDCPTPSLGGDLGAIAGLTPAPHWQPQAFSGSAAPGVTLLPGADGGGWIVTPPSIQPPTVPGAVPEPASWAMMIAGFGVIGMAARRKVVVA